MVGLFTVATIGVAVIWDLWELLDIRRRLTMQQFMNHFYARAIGLILVPVVIYLFWFYVHFAILVNSGPGDDFMSTEFQETLKGNTMADGICTLQLLGPMFALQMLRSMDVFNC